VSHEAVVALLEKRTGLRGEAFGPSAVSAAIAARARARGLTDLALYSTVVARDPAELQALAEELAVAETWFFRGRSLFTYLARCVRDEGPRADGRPFRALSVPCSSGEEPYSLAIALLESGVPRDWFRVEGADLSARSISAARLGLYGGQAFRETDPAIRARYFRPVGDRWEIGDSLRSAVRFAQGNVVEPGFLAGSSPFDLILCRNLFIYFGGAARAAAMANLVRLLATEGRLAVGHAEPIDAADPHFRPEGAVEYFLYRRVPRADVGVPSCSLASPSFAQPTVDHGPPQDLAPRSRAFSSTSNETGDIQSSLSQAAPAGNPSGTVSLVQVRELADAGRVEEALAACRAHLASGRPSAELLCLLGILHHARSDDDKAAEFFEKSLYLSPNNVESLLHLMLLRQGQGDVTRAALLRRRLERCRTEAAE
jgi:chemotaxis protein methyltransferase WspC